MLWRRRRRREKEEEEVEDKEEERGEKRKKRKRKKEATMSFMSWFQKSHTIISTILLVRSETSNPAHTQWRGIKLHLLK